jgi:hypothetical protein
MTRRNVWSGRSSVRARRLVAPAPRILAPDRTAPASSLVDPPQVRPSVLRPVRTRVLSLVRRDEAMGHRGLDRELSPFLLLGLLLPGVTEQGLCQELRWKPWEDCVGGLRGRTAWGNCVGELRPTPRRFSPTVFSHGFLPRFSPTVFSHDFLPRLSPTTFIPRISSHEFHPTNFHPCPLDNH